MYKRSIPEKIFSVFNVVILSLLAFITLYPFVYVASISFSTVSEAARSGFHFFPREVTLESYKMVFNNSSLIIAYGNTIFRTVVGTLLSLLVSSMFAYSLSRNNTPFKKVVLMLLLFTMLFSGGIIPSYMLIKNLGLLNNRWVYILPGLVAAYNVIILRNYFMALPGELHESAKVDGANEFLIFFKIILPLSTPVLATVALWLAVSHWNSWMDGILYITDNDKHVIQVMLQRLILQNELAVLGPGKGTLMQTFSTETVKSATIIVSIVPILIVYPFIQKYFTKGIMLGAVKG